MRFLLFIILQFILVFSFVKGENKDSIASRIDYNANKFKYLLEMIYTNYVDSVDVDLISEETFNSLLKNLDKQSAYYTKNRFYQKQEDDVGQKIGLGIDLKIINDTAVVYNVIENSPADKAGLEIFDRILKIDQHKVTACEINSINNFLQGEEGSSVDLMIIKSFTDKIANYNIKRGNVPLTSLYISLKIPGTSIGYISSRKFSKISHEEFLKKIEVLSEEGITDIILDLRDNPGGFLDQVGLIANEFLNPGEKISYTSARNENYRYSIESTASGRFRSLPIVVVINENSASACELFSGILQDLDRGLVVGKRSFGKGSVQKLWKMSDSSGFQMTVAKYYTPLGRKIDKTSDIYALDPSMRLILKDSAYNQVNDKLNEIGSIDKLPVFHSRKGRTLLGGGGIFPDYLVNDESQTLLTEVLINNNIIIEYVYNYLNINIGMIKNTSGKNLKKFLKNFIVSDLMLSDFKRHSYDKNIWNEEMFQRDKSKIKALLKAEIAKALFGNIGYYSVLINNDIFITKAIDVLPEAEDLIKN